MSKKEITHGGIIPLAGGFCIGATNVIKSPPKVLFSYSPFFPNDNLIIKYYKSLGHKIPYHILDKKCINTQEIIESYKGKIDFIHGVPPCSGLSQAAQRKAGTRGSAIPNDWMYTSANFVLESIKPMAYCFENAPNLYTGAGDMVRKRLIEIGEKTGYAITFYKTNTLHHGIPQYRPRTFAIFYKGNYAPIFNNYKREYSNILDYLNEIPKDAKHQNEYVHKEFDITKFEIYKFLKLKHGDEWRKSMNDFRHHLTTYDYLQRKDWLVEFLEWQKKLPDDERSSIVTKNVEHIIKNAEEGRGARINYRVLGVDKDYMYAVIGEVMGKQIHPKEDRIMNIREHMHMMGLPHDYNIENEKDYVKITQNVPVCTTEDITREVVATINEERVFSNKNVYMQDNSKIGPLNNSKYLF